MTAADLFQPIFSRKPEPGHTNKVLSFEHFLELLKQEEDYYPDEQHNTKLMFTRIRKIYYDSWGWSSQVIRKAAKIPGRYHTIMVPVENTTDDGSKNKGKTNKNNDLTSLTYKVSYTKQDKVYPERAGQTPEIYVDDGQELVNPQGFYCDIGHIFSGIDAFNNFEPISPLPSFLFFLRKLLPTVDSNLDFATWLGDIGSTAGDFLIETLKKKSISAIHQAETIDKDAPGSDMIGNIDAYAIKEIFNTQSANGLKVSEIISTYFYNPEIIKHYQSRVISIFCKEVGLKNWNGESFANEKEWIKYYKSQLRNATAFYVFGEVGKLKGMWLALKIWLHLFEKTLQLDLLLQILLKELKYLVVYEHKTNL